MIALHRKTITLERELRAAEAAFALDPTEEKLNALKAVREQLSSHAGSEAQIEGFGAALQKVLAQPDVQTKLTNMGLTVGFSSSQQLAAREAAYAKVWAKIIKDSGFVPQ